MKLGSKILLSFISISMAMAVVGLTVNWYSKSIQNKLVEDNIKTTRMVELTAHIERRLYQSLVFLSAVKETEELEVGSLTMDAPNLEMLTKNFYGEMGLVHQNLFMLQKQLEESLDTTDISQFSELELFEERFAFYEELSTQWLSFRKEDRGASSQVYNTSISPYFRNNIIPVISRLREKTVAHQIEQNQNLRNRLNQANLAISITSAFFVLLATAVGYYLYLHIANPLVQLIASAERLGKGNLDEHIELDRSDEIGKLADTFNTMAVKLKKRTMARDYLDNIIEAIQETLLVTDENDIIVGTNCAATQLLGYTKEELLGMSIHNLYVDDALPLKPYSTIKENEVFEFSLLTKEGSTIPVLFSEGILVNPKKELVGKVFVATDITQRKRASEKIKKSLKEKDVLLAEIHHRVKNNLAVISSILQLQSYSSNNNQVVNALNESQTRIKSISLVHEMLYQSETLANIEYGSYIKDLLNEISTMDFSLDVEMKLRAEVEPVLLDLNVAVPCSLLLNEIILHSYKHAYKEGEEGEILVTLKDIGEHIELTVKDNGVGLAGDENSLEQTLIQTLTNQLSGTCSTTLLDESKGTVTQIVFPKSVTLS